MEKAWVRWLVCLLLFLCGGVFFKLLPQASVDLKLDWNAFSAISTFAAVIVSLYLASSAERKLVAERRERSALAAARVWPIAEALNGHLSDLSGWVYFDNLDDPEKISDIRERVKRLRVYLDCMKIDDVERIVAIDISVASYLSRAIGEIEGVVVSVEREGKEWDTISQVSKEFYRKHWGDAILIARDFLLMALPSLKHAAQKAAPIPDWAEIYGKDD
ncbi:hypothetical protein KSS94_09945 [Pseudomonas fakonensis]|uniref:DUF4760 domain-containing protein n=1 Tax=Pseudomonas fakonensis TaxID=2842355 RepID=A0ABX8NBM3_9PSED|nr:hypothetical protein [Pseudomonas fakonensis]QXH53407.1 hypothetical protein KSS94_09945 [Pseudomonas fakonensis]